MSWLERVSTVSWRLIEPTLVPSNWISKGPRRSSRAPIARTRGLSRSQGGIPSRVNLSVADTVALFSSEGVIGVALISVAFRCLNWMCCLSRVWRLGFVGLEADPEIVLDEGGEQPDGPPCEDEGSEGSRMARESGDLPVGHLEGWRHPVLSMHSSSRRLSHGQQLGWTPGLAYEWPAGSSPTCELSSCEGH